MSEKLSMEVNDAAPATLSDCPISRFMRPWGNETQHPFPWVGAG